MRLVIGFDIPIDMEVKTTQRKKKIFEKVELSEKLRGKCKRIQRVCMCARYRVNNDWVPKAVCKLNLVNICP